MCGRFQLNVVLDEILDRYGISESNIDFSPSNEIFPSNISPIVIKENGKNKLRMMKWGLKVPFIKRLLINARSETIYSKPTFRDSFISRRCLIPVSGYYEWKKDNDKSIKYIITTKDELFSLAGIYKAIQDGKGNMYDAYAIITCCANEDIIDIHHRMPVIIRKDKENIWLDKNIEDTSILMNILKNSSVKLLKEKI